jgi:hypothetical protein
MGKCTGVGRAMETDARHRLLSTAPLVPLPDSNLNQGPRRRRLEGGDQFASARPHPFRGGPRGLQGALHPTIPAPNFLC